MMSELVGVINPSTGSCTIVAVRSPCSIVFFSNHAIIILQGVPQQWRVKP